MKTFNITLIILLTAIICACDKEPNEDINGNIRGAVKLSTNKIPALDGATEIKSGDRPWLWIMGWNGVNYDFVKYTYAWAFSDTSFVCVDMVITESDEQALRYITEKRETSSIPLHLLQPEDQPTIAGDISFGQGREFIRDNIVIEIDAEGVYEDKTDKLAQQIDKIIIKGPGFFSLSDIKPVINNFQITENPVVERTKTRIDIEVTDPNDKEISYQWNFNTITGLGGNVILENGDFFYEANLTFTSVETNEEDLTVIAINEFGFFTTSTISITTIKE